MKPWFKRLAAWIEKRGGAREIYRDENGAKVLYLKRYYIVKCPWVEIFIHQFFRGDVGPIHDHPFPSTGRILEGEYWEHMIKHIFRVTSLTRKGEYDLIPNESFRVRRTAGFFKWASRPAASPNHDNPKSFHRVELRPEDIDKGVVWTLFITGCRVPASWGFLENNQFIPYLDMFIREGTTAKQSDHTQYKGWLFPVKIT